jgi:hypothetical protein
LIREGRGRKEETHLNSLHRCPLRHPPPHTLPVLQHEAPSVIPRQLLVWVPLARPEALQSPEPREPLLRRDVQRRVDLVREVQVVLVLDVATSSPIGEVFLQLLLFLLGRQVGERLDGDGSGLVGLRVDELVLLVRVDLLASTTSSSLGLHLIVVLVVLLDILLIVVKNPRRLVGARPLHDLLQLRRRSGERRRGHLAPCPGSSDGGGCRSEFLLRRPSLLVHSEVVFVGDVGRSERVGIVVGGGERVERSGNGGGGSGGVDRHRLGGSGSAAFRRASGRSEEDLYQSKGSASREEGKNG